MNRRCGEEGLSFPRMKPLLILESEGPQAMHSLSDHLGVTPRNVTALVDALEEEGLVRRTPHPTDRRATIIELTPHGKEVTLEARQRFEAAATELFGRLSEEDQDALERMNEKIRAVLVEALEAGPKASPLKEAV